jgi:flagellar motor component MotA
MFVLIGYGVALGCIFGAYVLHGGNMSVIIHALPTELMAILGVALGAFVVNNQPKVLKATIKLIDIDHLLDPIAILTQIRAKLRPHGTLMIVTHDEQSLLRRLMGVRWPPFCLQHPELYNPATMRALLIRAGYADVAVERSRNHFPIDFLARQAAWTLGVKLNRVPLPSVSIGLRLGNILTLASAPVQAAERISRPVAA